MMTFKEFIVKLKDTNLIWEMNSDHGYIRSYIDQSLNFKCHCPISAVSGDITNFENPFTAGARMGLKDIVINRIVKASDGGLGARSATRKALLQACGLG